jgi:hypothetical protein
MRLVEHIPRVEEMSSAYKILAVKPERKAPFWRRRPEWDNIKVDAKELRLAATLGSGFYSAFNIDVYKKKSFWSRARPALKADNFTVICEPTV